ncbi:MAG TPA: hypothetical protein PLP21_04680 [Pyrinomonadaceae bacterium]|nr:hypothetical protein [Acidobacteriota bacterium]HQZ95589.1 hypothetical protein [Pyrinomonadaceae bacterium]
MPEMPKRKIDAENNAEKPNWAEDQKDRGYYYDDSHGYEVYDPDTEDDEREEDVGSEIKKEDA